MELHWAILAKGGLAIKFIILIETSEIHTYYFKSKWSENKKYIIVGGVKYELLILITLE
jgi:hypothetical protein